MAWAARIVGAVFGLMAAPLMADSFTARYVTPADAYGHGAVQGGEYAALEVTFADGTTRQLSNADAVFEDTAPRLFDFDGDGTSEIVTVVSGFTTGARVQIYKIENKQIVPMAANAPIGTPNRWLAIAGIADFDGDGVVEIAYIDRPHLARRAVFLSVDPRPDQTAQLSERRFDAPLLSNHRYGAPMIEGGVRTCGKRPELIVASGDWNDIVSVEMRPSGRLASKTLGAYSGPDSFTPHLTCD